MLGSEFVNLPDLSGRIPLPLPLMVKTNFLLGNQQVTNVLSKLVGTSEAIRPLTYKQSHALSTSALGTKEDASEKSWNQWLAGLIDGDGSLLISSSD